MKRPRRRMSALELLTVHSSNPVGAIFHFLGEAIEASYKLHRHMKQETMRRNAPYALINLVPEDVMEVIGVSNG